MKTRRAILYQPLELKEKLQQERISSERILLRLQKTLKVELSKSAKDAGSGNSKLLRNLIEQYLDMEKPVQDLLLSGRLSLIGLRFLDLSETDRRKFLAGELTSEQGKPKVERPRKTSSSRKDPNRNRRESIRNVPPPGEEEGYKGEGKPE